MDKDLIITMDGVNKLKNYLFEKAADKSGRIGTNYMNFDHKKYEKLKREIKKNLKFKIVFVPEIQ